MPKKVLVLFYPLFHSVVNDPVILDRNGGGAFHIHISNKIFPGMKTLTEMLTEREAIAQLCETILDEGTEHWGVKVGFG